MRTAKLIILPNLFLILVTYRNVLLLFLGIDSALEPYKTNEIRGTKCNYKKQYSGNTFC